MLEKLDAIKGGDALVSIGKEGEYEEAKWPEAEFIVGNPPFLGGQKLRAAFQLKYLESLTGLYRQRIPPGQTWLPIGLKKLVWQLNKKSAVGQDWLRRSRSAVVAAESRSIGSRRLQKSLKRGRTRSGPSMALTSAFQLFVLETEITKNG